MAAFADEVTSTSELLGLESQDDEDQVWIGPLGEELDVANGYLFVLCRVRR